MDTLRVTRLLQNPLGEPAPEGARGDIVRVTDGSATIYMLPGEFDRASRQHLRWLLTAAAMPASSPSPLLHVDRERRQQMDRDRDHSSAPHDRLDPAVDSTRASSKIANAAPGHAGAWRRGRT